MLESRIIGGTLSLPVLLATDNETSTENGSELKTVVIRGRPLCHGKRQDGKFEKRRPIESF